jgi:hypothetical protein
VVGGQKRVNTALPGGEKIGACKCVRDTIAHSKADLTDFAAAEIDGALRNALNLGKEPSLLADKFILSKDRVIRPLWDAAWLYAAAVIEQEALPESA